MGSYFAVFAFMIIFLNKNNVRSVISVKKCVDWYRDVSVQKQVFKFFVCVGPKVFWKIFSSKIYKWHVYRFTFWWKLRICYHFYENMYRKNENPKIRAHFEVSLQTFKSFHIQSLVHGLLIALLSPDFYED